MGFIFGCDAAVGALIAENEGHHRNPGVRENSQAVVPHHGGEFLGGE